MGTTTDDLLALARSVSPAPNPRELDMLITTGERIACALCAMAVSGRGHAAVALTGAQAGIVTTSGHGDARIVDVRTHRIEHELHRGALVLVAGFQGVSTDREVTSLGRGGADTTAVALASALGATRCDVFTGVAPPATSNGAISHDALARLVAAGAFPMSLRSLEIARDHGVRLQLCSSSGDEPDVWVVTED
jgi:aspartate kinase